MTNQPKIVTEWNWQPAMHPSSRYALYEKLIWRGLVLGTIETFYDVGPWYGNIGDGRPPLDYTYRTGAMGNHEACRRRVEENVLRALNEGLGGAGAAGASAGAVKAGPKNIERAFLLAADKAAASARSAAAANVVGPLCEAYGAIANEIRRLAKMVLNGEEIRDTNGLPWAPVVEPVKAGDEVVREALKTAIGHIEHMSAWIALRNAGYSFEGLGEDMPGIRAALDGAAGVAAKREPGFIKPDNDRQVFFYEQDFYVLSNFAAFNLDWSGKHFDTSEAAYHWEKFVGNDPLRLMIRGATSAHEAFKIAEEHKHLRRPDWDDVKVDIMRDILRAKAAQHEYVRRKLIATGDRELIEDSWRDDFWGWGPNCTGKNMLGKLWMEIRTEIGGR